MWNTTAGTFLKAILTHLKLTEINDKYLNFFIWYIVYFLTNYSYKTSFSKLGNLWNIREFWTFCKYLWMQLIICSHIKRTEIKRSKNNFEIVKHLKCAGRAQQTKTRKIFINLRIFLVLCHPYKFFYKNCTKLKNARIWIFCAFLFVVLFLHILSA